MEFTHVPRRPRLPHNPFPPSDAIHREWVIYIARTLQSPDDTKQMQKDKYKQKYVNTHTHKYKHKREKGHAQM